MQLKDSYENVLREAVQEYWSSKEHFADFINAAMYDGEPCVRANELEEIENSDYLSYPTPISRTLMTGYGITMYTRKRTLSPGGKEEIFRINWIESTVERSLGVFYRDSGRQEHEGHQSPIGRTVTIYFIKGRWIRIFVEEKQVNPFLVQKYFRNVSNIDLFNVLSILCDGSLKHYKRKRSIWRYLWYGCAAECVRKIARVEAGLEIQEL